MPWFKCFIHGENFHGCLIDQQQEAGFYTTRLVEAKNAEQAELLALENLRQEPSLALPKAVSVTDQTRVFFEEITQITPQDVPKTKVGLAWYVEDGT